MDPVLGEKVREVVNCLSPRARAILMVGGCVRDHLLGLPIVDVDLEVYGLDYDTIVRLLADRGWKLNLVGRQFAVLKVDDRIDVSIPRRENKSGVGHRAFTVSPDPEMTFAEASLRRDFTINAMGMDFSGHLLDPHGGASDLKQGMLKAVGPGFSEDPLRVLRALQFAGRFNLSLDGDTAQLCQSLIPEFASLPGERIWGEWEKWAARSEVPSAGLRALEDAGWLNFFPELHNLKGVPQDPEWHPEGDVYTHTLHVVDAAAGIANRDALPASERILLLLGALCHDLGKAVTTVRGASGRWTSPDHARAGVPLTQSFLERISAPPVWADRVCPLVAEHMVHIFPIEPPSLRAVRRLAHRLTPATLRQLERVVAADHSGRPPLPAGRPLIPWLEVARTLELQDSQPKPVLLGRHLLKLGYQPGKSLGTLLQAAFEAQMDGAFQDLPGALRWLASSGFDLQPNGQGSTGQERSQRLTE